MIVKFFSSASGELVMMADTARPLLKAIGKHCTAEGVITQSEMRQAVVELERYLDHIAPQEPPPDEEKEKHMPAMLRPVSLRQRAWPLIKMLNRTAQTKKESRITWQAAQDFEV
ncbi:MAG: DUF1840 domain-containing protein [Zoogloeaceae bacterium]|jgi:hypothetical protein|nr:DUF1840 domain-containing protein [Zoogloeaceae bacterium]